MKVLMIIGDGMGDTTYKELKRQTPMESAYTPNLDQLTQNAVTGMLYPIGEGNVPSSTVAHRALLGDFEFRKHIGRGIFAAMSSKLKIKEGDIAFRCDLSTIIDGIVTDERAGRIKDTKDIEKIINSLSPIGGIEFEYSPIKEYRGALIIRKNSIFTDYKISDIFSFEGQKINKAISMNKESEALAVFVNNLFEKIHFVLSDISKTNHCLANAITLRGASQYSEITSNVLSEKNIKGAFITGIPDVYGVFKYCGLIPLANTSDIDLKEIDKNQYIDPILDNIKKYDLFVINIGSFDAASHDGNLIEKVKLFEQLDQMVGYFQESIKEPVSILVTADHCTLCKTKQHSMLPVPFILKNEQNDSDNVDRFSESSIREKGILGNINNGNVVAKMMAGCLGKGYYVS